MAKVLAELDLAAGLRTKNIEVPAMKAVVAWNNPDALKGYDTKQEKVVVQSLIDKAYTALTKARDEVKSAIEDFDAQLTKKPAADEKEAADRLRTFQNTCKQIVTAQQGKVEKEVESVWEMHKKRDKALTKLNLVFAAKIVFATLSLAASITLAALSVGALAPTIIGAAKTVVSTALLVKDFAIGRDGVAKECYAMDQTLWKVYMGPQMKGQAFRTAKEVAQAAGMPFIDTVGKLEKRIEDFLAQSARVDKQNQKLFKEANTLMSETAGIDAKKAGAANAKLADQMGKQVDALLSEIGELSRSIDGDNAFYKTYTERCKVYNAMNGKAVGASAKAVEYGQLAASIAAAAKSVVDIAIKLA
jgi:hypothetical protein